MSILNFKKKEKISLLVNKDTNDLFVLAEDGRVVDLDGEMGSVLYDADTIDLSNSPNIDELPEMSAISAKKIVLNDTLRSFLDLPSAQTVCFIGLNERKYVLSSLPENVKHLVFIGCNPEVVPLLKDKKNIQSIYWQGTAPNDLMFQLPKSLRCLTIKDTESISLVGLSLFRKLQSLSLENTHIGPIERRPAVFFPRNLRKVWINGVDNFSTLEGLADESQLKEVKIVNCQGLDKHFCENRPKGVELTVYASNIPNAVLPKNVSTSKKNSFLDKIVRGLFCRGRD